jgi:hypothetical protein
MPKRAALSETMEPEEGRQETGEGANLQIDDAIDDEAAAPDGLGAIGQLAAAVVVVAVLLAAFIFGSAVLRRVLG